MSAKNTILIDGQSTAARRRRNECCGHIAAGPESDQKTAVLLTRDIGGKESTTYLSVIVGQRMVFYLLLLVDGASKQATYEGTESCICVKS